MTATRQKKTLTLENRAEALWEELRAKSPLEVAELQLILRILEERRQGEDRSYQLVRAPGTAVMMLLTEERRAMSKREIYEELEKRGYPIDSSSKKGLVNDAINRLVASGKLLRVGNGERSEMIVKLPAIS